MPFLELFDFALYFLFGFFHRLADLASGLISLFRSSILVRLMNLLRGILSVAHSLLDGPLYLIHNALVG
jgi:hypothetical protein